MKFPASWLRQHVAYNATAEGLAERLTAIGLEVEDMQRLGEGLDGVVVARIIDCSPHPQDDRLQVCTVDEGGSASSEEHTSELQSLLRRSYADFCLKKQ